jgi:hypothetical protein
VSARSGGAKGQRVAGHMLRCLSLAQRVGEHGGSAPVPVVLAENRSERKSCRFPHIAVMQPTDPGQLDEPSQLGPLHLPRVGGVSLQREVTVWLTAHGRQLRGGADACPRCASTRRSDDAGPAFPGPDHRASSSAKGQHRTGFSAGSTWPGDVISTPTKVQGLRGGRVSGRDTLSLGRARQSGGRSRGGGGHR